MNDKTLNTSRFYDKYWPENIPDSNKTREYVATLLPLNEKKGNFHKTLDAGCGTGVCSLALSGYSDRVTSVDISKDCLITAQKLALQTNIDNIEFIQASLLSLPFENNTFDLVYCWGVAHHTADPRKAIRELSRVLAPGGYFILALYWKTILTPVHEAIRKICVRCSHIRLFKLLFIKTVAALVKFFQIFLKKNRESRDDNYFIESQVEDWYFVPEKHFFTPPEIRELFKELGLEFTLLATNTGRFKSSSNFVVRGLKS